MVWGDGGGNPASHPILSVDDPTLLCSTLQEYGHEDGHEQSEFLGLAEKRRVLGRFQEVTAFKGCGPLLEEKDFLLSQGPDAQSGVQDIGREESHEWEPGKESVHIAGLGIPGPDLVDWNSDLVLNEIGERVKGVAPGHGTEVFTLSGGERVTNGIVCGGLGPDLAEWSSGWRAGEDSDVFTELEPVLPHEADGLMLGVHCLNFCRQGEDLNPQGQRIVHEHHR